MLADRVASAAAFSSDASSHATSRRGRSPRGHVENASQANGWRSGGHALGQPRALLHKPNVRPRGVAPSPKPTRSLHVRLQFCGSKPITTARRRHVVIPAKGLMKPQQRKTLNSATENTRPQKTPMRQRQTPSARQHKTPGRQKTPKTARENTRQHKKTQPEVIGPLLLQAKRRMSEQSVIVTAKSGQSTMICGVARFILRMSETC